MTKYLIRIILLVLFTSAIASCGSKNERIMKELDNLDYGILRPEENISFVTQVRPVLESRCIVCHGCYDAPCQLKLTSIEGIKRGANPKKVYNAGRIFAEQPTRLYIDAGSTPEWREKGFHSVLNEEVDNATNNLRHSLLYKMLRLKQLNPQPRVGKIDSNIDLSIDRKQACPTNEKFNTFADEFPDLGMPFAMPNLSDDEYHVLVKWISQGMPDDNDMNFPDATMRQVKKWEKFLNRAEPKHKLFSRYLYEHLVLGHIYFKGESERKFFRLVRSYTPPGEEVKEIPTVKAYDDPGVNQFYYRLRYYESSIVDKTHVVYEFSDKRMARYRELFFNDDYQVSEFPPYERSSSFNPILTFNELPVKSRYLFLLDDAKFFLEGFIKGPVCRGQVALNVIEDNFWVFFFDPDKIEVNNNAHFLDSITAQLNLPAENGNGINILDIWTKYWEQQHSYMLERQKRFQSLKKLNLDEALEAIWNGQNSMDDNNRALTIFRHFDNATVKQGLIGDYPETAWIIDYPLFERIHYLLVAGYDVYGNVSHQLNTRLYMDFLRMDGENSFLAFLPVSHRKKIRDSWYKGIREMNESMFEQPMDWMRTQVVFGFKTDDPQRELYQKLESRMMNSPDKMDFINRCYQSDCINPDGLSHVDKQMQRIAKIKGLRLEVFPDLSLLKVIGDNGSQAYTIIRNKAYKNISFLLEDVVDRDRSMDTLTIYKGILGAYPNFFFVVHENEIGQFTDEILAIKNITDYERFVGAYGVRRTSSSFWENSDWFYQEYARQDPIGYGVLDLYRYSNQ